MAHKLIYGANEFWIRDDEDLDALAVRIDKGLQSGSPTWISLDLVRGGTARILATPGVPIALQTGIPGQGGFTALA